MVEKAVKNPPAMQKTQVRSLGWEDPLEKGMATHSSILAWRIHRQRSLVGYSPWGYKEFDMTEWLTLIYFAFTNQSRKGIFLEYHNDWILICLPLLTEVVISIQICEATREVKEWADVWETTNRLNGKGENKILIQIISILSVLLRSKSFNHKMNPICCLTWRKDSLLLFRQEFP